MAFTILVLSVATAVAALLAGMTAHETLIDRTEEIIELSIAGTDQLTTELLRTTHETERALASTSNHMLLPIAATVAIAITGLAPIVRQRWLWAVGMLVGVLATILLVVALGMLTTWRSDQGG